MGTANCLEFKKKIGKPYHLADQGVEDFKSGGYTNVQVVGKAAS